MDINPINVIAVLTSIAKSEFPHLTQTEVSLKEKLFGELLFKKLGQMWTKYEFVEENDNYQGTTLNQPSQSSSEEFSPQVEPSNANFVSIKQKAKILKFYDEKIGRWKFKTIQRSFPLLKHPIYVSRWRKQVNDGGSSLEIFQEIRLFTYKKFCEAREDGCVVHDDDLRRRALQRATDFPSVRTSFLASHPWLSRFKKEYGICSRKITKLVKKGFQVTNEQTLIDAENFRKEIQNLSQNYDLKEIWNTDQIGFAYEYVSNRTLSFQGEDDTFASGFSPKNGITHSYTVQYIISADGSIVGNAFLCLQEPNGRIGEIAKQQMFQPPNVTITCSASGKLTSSHVEYFVQKLIQPNLPESRKCLYILDSWGGQLNDKIYNEVTSVKDSQFNRKIIPKGCTPILQPLGVYFNLQLKYLVKKIYNYANVNNIRIIHRNGIIKTQSLADYILSAPVFRPMIQYSFIKAGLILKENREYFESVKDVCFRFSGSVCEIDPCTNVAFISCSWCQKLHSLIVMLSPFF